MCWDYSTAASAADCPAKPTPLNCGQGQHEENNTCVNNEPLPLDCGNTQHEENGICVNDEPTPLDCGEGQHEENNTCVNDQPIPLTCGQGQHEENHTCVNDQPLPLDCGDTQHEENGICVNDEPTPLDCGEGQHEENNTCVNDKVTPLDCGEGKHEENNTCVNDQPTPLDCGEGQHEENNTCVDDKATPLDCGEGKHEENNTCVNDKATPLDCGAGKHEENNTCVNDKVAPLDCGSGKHEENNTCVNDEATPLDCGEGKHEENNTCVNDKATPLDCGAGKHEENNTCVNDKVAPLDCGEGKHEENNTCVNDEATPLDCGEGEHEENNACVMDKPACTSGQIEDATGGCHPQGEKCYDGTIAEAGKPCDEQGCKTEVDCPKETPICSSDHICLSNESAGILAGAGLGDNGDGNEILAAAALPAGTLLYRGMSSEAAAEFLTQIGEGKGVLTLNPSSMGYVLPETAGEFVEEQFDLHYVFGKVFDPPLPGVVPAKAAPGLFFSTDPGVGDVYSGSEGVVVTITPEQARAAGLSIGTDVAAFSPGGTGGVYVYSPTGEMGDIKVNIVNGGTAPTGPATSPETIPPGPLLEDGEWNTIGNLPNQPIEVAPPGSNLTGAARATESLGSDLGALAGDMFKEGLGLIGGVLATSTDMNSTTPRDANGKEIMEIGNGLWTSLPPPPGGVTLSPDGVLFAAYGNNGWTQTNMQTGIVNGWSLNDDGTAVSFTEIPLPNYPGVYYVQYSNGGVALADASGHLIANNNGVPIVSGTSTATVSFPPADDGDKNGNSGVSNDYNTHNL